MAYLTSAEAETNSCYRVNFIYQILCTSETFSLFSILIPNSKFVIENKEKSVINSNHIQASSLLLIFMTQFTHKGRKCFSVYFFGVNFCSFILHTRSAWTRWCCRKHSPALYRTHWHENIKQMNGAQPYKHNIREHKYIYS